MVTPRKLTNVKVKSIAAGAQMHGVGDNSITCNVVKMMMIEGCGGVTNLIGLKNHVLYMGLKEVKGLAMFIVLEMALGAENVGGYRATMSMYTASGAASCVVATCARAPGVVTLLVLRFLVIVPAPWVIK